MDRDTLIAYINKCNKGELTAEEATIIISEYCIDRDKDPEKTKELMNILPLTGMLPHCTTRALEWFKKKFGVIEILQPHLGGTYKVIKVF